jgi:hypothetical protein
MWLRPVMDHVHERFVGDDDEEIEEDEEESEGEIRKLTKDGVFITIRDIGVY